MIRSLTGLRFFAAFAILLTHSQSPGLIPEGTFRGFTLAGAVPLFFVLSGFVLTINAEKYKSTVDFYVARWARVWPAHVAALLFWFTIFYPYSPSLLQGEDNVRRAVLNLFLLQAWSPNIATFFSLNAPSWSVSVEIFFYAVFPLVLSALRRWTWGKVAVLYALVIAGFLLIERAVPGLGGPWLGYINPVVNLPTFALGVATGVVYLRTEDEALPRGSVIQFGAILAVAVANVLMTYLGEHVAKGTLSSFLSVSGPAPVYAALIYVLARYDGAPSRFLSTPLIVFLGEISYSLYLFHQLVIRWHSEKHWNLLPEGQVLIIWAMCIAIAAISYLTVEKAARYLIRGGWSILQRPVVPQAAS